MRYVDMSGPPVRYLNHWHDCVVCQALGSLCGVNHRYACVACEELVCLCGLSSTGMAVWRVNHWCPYVVRVV